MQEPCLKCFEDLNLILNNRCTSEISIFLAWHLPHYLIMFCNIKKKIWAYKPIASSPGRDAGQHGHPVRILDHLEVLVDIQDGLPVHVPEDDVRGLPPANLYSVEAVQIG